jgi:peptidoglycan/LPS O-acetylase OafA/YrhL
VDVALNVALAVTAVGLVDWLFFTRVGGFFYGEFDYRYWPLSKARLLSLFVMVCTVLWAVLFGPRPDPDNPPMWALIPLGFVLVLHIIVGYRDIAIQRRIGYRRPPRYVNTDEY